MKKYYIYDCFNDEFYEGDINRIEKTLDAGNPLVISNEKLSNYWINLKKENQRLKEEYQQMTESLAKTKDLMMNATETMNRAIKKLRGE